jgi:pimeloyl-ACP methyl ester carboxylesterase
MQPFVVKTVGFGLNVLAKVAPQLAGKKGFELFCHPFRTKLKKHHLAFFHSAKMFRMEFRGLDIQCYQWGSGSKTVLFLHGWQSHSFRWKTYVEAFVQQGYTVYALDAPGHGLSGGSQLNLLLYSELVKDFLYRQASIDHIIAHSFGGYASVYALYCTPLLPVKKLVLMGTPGKVTDFIDTYNEMLGLKANTLQVVRQHFIATVGKDPEYFDAPKLARSLYKPVLIVHDTDDTDTPYSHAAAMYANWRNAQMLTTSGLGHNLKSPEIMRQVMQFIKEEPIVIAPAKDNIFLPVHSGDAVDDR